MDFLLCTRFLIMCRLNAVETSFCYSIVLVVLGSSVLALAILHTYLLTHVLRFKTHEIKALCNNVHRGGGGGMIPTESKKLGGLTWTCDKCGKILSSLYPKSLKVQIANHKLSHELKDQEKEKNGSQVGTQRTKNDVRLPDKGISWV